MQAPDQGQGMIAEQEGRIKLHAISNLVISLDRQISSTVVDSPIITQLQLWSLGYKLNHSQVMVPQSTSTIGSS
jgi:hypothetical protein